MNHSLVYAFTTFFVLTGSIVSRQSPLLKKIEKAVQTKFMYGHETCEVQEILQTEGDMKSYNPLYTTARLGALIRTAAAYNMLNLEDQDLLIEEIRELLAATAYASPGMATVPCYG